MRVIVFMIGNGMIEWDDGHGWNKKDQLMYIYAVSAKDTKIKKIIKFIMFACLLIFIVYQNGLIVNCSKAV